MYTVAITSLDQAITPSIVVVSDTPLYTTVDPSDCVSNILAVLSFAVYV